MSIAYAESNEESSRNLFYKKMVYLATMAQYDHVNLVDFNFAEKVLYGRVTRHFEPMVLSGAPNTKLKNFSSNSDLRLPNSALPFVVDAFEALKQQFDKCLMNGKISNTDSYLSSLKVYKAYVSPKKLYKEYISEFAEGVSVQVKELENKVINFDEFVLKLMPILEMICREEPFTFPAFIKSKSCSINSSGLAVEIADLSHDNDLDKIKKFVVSPNWEFYLNACNSYGFMVDMRNPWRLVADIAGHSTLEYSSAYGLRTTDHIIDIAYDPAHSMKYFYRFKDSLLELYNQSIERRVTRKSNICEDGKVIVTTRTPQRYSRESFFARYDELYFLELYFRIRFLEEESEFKEGEKAQIIDNCKDLFSVDSSMAMNSFERILNKTLDYSGAINYIIERRKQLAV